MKTNQLNNLANIKITKENCDELIAESLGLANKAMLFKARSGQIKRGIANKREQQRIAGAMK